MEVEVKMEELEGEVNLNEIDESGAIKLEEIEREQPNSEEFPKFLEPSKEIIPKGFFKNYITGNLTPFAARNRRGKFKKPRKIKTEPTTPKAPKKESAKKSDSVIKDPAANIAEVCDIPQLFNPCIRMVDLNLMAKLLWCNHCCRALSLRNCIEDENNLFRTVLKIQCEFCSEVKEVSLSLLDKTGGCAAYQQYMTTRNANNEHKILTKACMEVKNRLENISSVEALEECGRPKRKKRVKNFIDMEMQTVETKKQRGRKKGSGRKKNETANVEGHCLVYEKRGKSVREPYHPYPYENAALEPETILEEPQDSRPDVEEILDPESGLMTENEPGGEFTWPESDCNDHINWSSDEVEEVMEIDEGDGKLRKTVIKNKLDGAKFDWTDFDAHPSEKVVDVPEKCPHCSEDFPNLPDLNAHLKKSHFKLMQERICYVCGKMCKGYHALDCHLWSHLPFEEASIPCPKCPKLFRTKAHMSKHMYSHAPSFTCEFCKKTIRQRDRLTEHMMLHIENKTYDCEICGAQFVRKDNRNTHMKNNHNWMCLVCFCQFSRMEDVKSHADADHSQEEIESNKVNGVAFEKVTKFQCKVCFRYLASKQSLEFHLNTHTGDGKKRPQASGSRKRIRRTEQQVEEEPVPLQDPFKIILIDTLHGPIV